jgi:hypothetical protein
MVSSGHSPRLPNEAPLKTSPENTNKSEVTTWAGQLLKIEQTDFINNTIENSGKQKGHVHYQKMQLLRTVRARASTRREP